MARSIQVAFGTEPDVTITNFFTIANFNTSRSKCKVETISFVAAQCPFTFNAIFRKVHGCHMVVMEPFMCTSLQYRTRFPHHYKSALKSACNAAGSVFLFPVFLHFCLIDFSSSWSSDAVLFSSSSIASSRRDRKSCSSLLCCSIVEASFCSNAWCDCHFSAS
jgi:hypothetical protein